MQTSEKKLSERRKKYISLGILASVAGFLCEGHKKTKIIAFLRPRHVLWHKINHSFWWWQISGYIYELTKNMSNINIVKEQKKDH